MTRKDYELLALHLKQALGKLEGIAKAFPDDATQRAACNGAVQAISAVANALASDNARFNRDRFLKACGVE